MICLAHQHVSIKNFDFDKHSFQVRFMIIYLYSKNFTYNELYARKIISLNIILNTHLNMCKVFIKYFLGSCWITYYSSCESDTSITSQY